VHTLIVKQSTAKEENQSIDNKDQINFVVLIIKANSPLQGLDMNWKRSII